MLKKIADNRDADSIAVGFRRKRYAFFQTLLMQVERPIHILDIGGTETYWKMMGLTLEDQISVTLLNPKPISITSPFLTYVTGEARNVRTADNSFDVVFSNSVIEHVGDYHAQEKMAKEVQRIAKRYFVQTPNRYFPIEPHFLFPFFQFLPMRVRVRLLQNFALGWFSKTPDETEARGIVESIRLLDRHELMKFFPKASIYEEKIFGLTKSFVAYGGWSE